MTQLSLLDEMKEFDISMRRQILMDAIQAVDMDKRSEHGDAKENFELISDLWTTYLGTLVTRRDVCQMMVLLKIARSSVKPHNSDNYIDAAGYSALAAEMENED